MGANQRLRKTFHAIISAGMLEPDISDASAMAALRLQIEWGADDALDAEPLDRTQPRPVARVALTSPTPMRPAASRPAAPERAQALASAALTLPELDAALDAFEGCPLRATATKTVLPSGNPDAGLVLVGEAPGAEDDRSGMAFSGPPGALLDRMLASIGLDRTRILVTTLVPWRPPGNRAPADAEIQACLPFLLRRFQLVRPRRLVLLGSAPVKAITGSTDGMRRLRGRWRQVELPGLEAPIAVLPMLPLDQALRTPASKQASWADLITLRLALNER